MTPLYLNKENQTANEPKVHPLIRESFFFVHSAGMRLAPEVLILELMREIFFDAVFGETTGSQELRPDLLAQDGSNILTVNEQAVVGIMKGRRKKTKGSNENSFFAPAYPALARYGWMRKNSERVVKNFLFSGPIAQFLWGSGYKDEVSAEMQKDMGSAVWKALIGEKSNINNFPKDSDILVATLGNKDFNFYKVLPFENFYERTKPTNNIVKIGEKDPIAERITKDFLAICEIEGVIPRMQWLQLLMTFLRFALPMWLLSQMRLTRLLHAWLIDAIEGNSIVSAGEIQQRILTRNLGLLCPSITPTRELFEQIELYMKSRVEVNILLYTLEQIRHSQIAQKRLALYEEGKSVVNIQELLILAKNAAADIKKLERFTQVAPGLSINTYLIREAEQFSAWQNPLMKGQGKNIDEFFRLLYKSENGIDEGGYLLAPEGRGLKRGLQVFPGQLQLKTMTFLASQSKNASKSKGGAGKLVLQDVEDIFRQYGIDFSLAADVRPRLMNELKAMGLLTGSPDAGSSVTVNCPY